VPVPDRGKDIQTALKNSGFYTGAIDGKIGPKTKSAIMEFQKAKGLKPDGRVGPKTWAELEKYLLRQ
jgi:peptidoglycan hydrolase-like protein with peptidoglycan-binding domain